MRHHRSPTRIAAILSLTALALTACPKQRDVRDRSSVDYVDRAPTRPADRPRDTPAGPPAPSPAADPQARVLIARADAAGEDDPVEARQLYWAVIARYKGTTEAVTARAALAEDAVERGDFEDARSIVADAPPLGDEAAPTDVGFRLAFVLARAEEGLQRFKDAAAAFAHAVDVALSPPQKELAAEGQARSAFLAGDVAQATGAVDAHLVLAPGETVRSRLVGVVEPVLTPERLQQLYDTLPPSEPWRGWVALRLAEHYCANAAVQRCAEALATARAFTADIGWNDDAQALWERVQRWNSVRPRTVGVLLPLSGKYGAIGQAARDALALAAEARKDVTLVFADTEGDAGKAAALAEKLVLEDHVAALIGPVGAIESAAAAEVAARYAIPQIVLTGADGVAATGKTVLRLRLGAREEAAAVARHAAVELGVKRVGIVYPDTDAGRAWMTAFWDESVRLGGEVWAVETYAPDTSDFSPVLSRLLAAREPKKVTAEALDFHALFVPDRATTIRRMVPFLNLWTVPVKTAPTRQPRRGVQLLGTSGWNDKRVADVGGGLTDNAIFVDGFYHDPDDPAADAFARAWFRAYQSAPATFHAEVYDASQVLLAAVAAVDGADHVVREQILQRLLSTRNFQGATGLISLMDSGVVLRKPRILTVDGQMIRLRLSEDEERAVRELRDVQDR